MVSRALFHVAYVAILVLRISNGFQWHAATPCDMLCDMSTIETLTAFAEALAALGIDPREVEVSLTVPDWKALDQQLAQEHADGLFEGVGVTGEITVKGVRYLVRFG